MKKVKIKSPTASNRKSSLVGVVMGSDTDLKWMQDACDALKKFGVPFEIKIISAHRTPKAVEAYASSSEERGLRVIIAGAGGAAHLPGMLAAHTTTPVIGVPCPVGPMQGEDALWSIVQMPKGVPVATVAIGNGWNAGVLATQILATGDSKLSLTLRKVLNNYKIEMEKLVEQMNKKLTTSRHHSGV